MDYIIFMIKQAPTIEIKGVCGAGKTVLASMIADILHNYGISCHVEDIVGTHKIKGEFYPNWKEFLGTLKFDKPISINTTQLNRTFMELMPPMSWKELEDIECKQRDPENYDIYDVYGSFEMAYKSKMSYEKMNGNEGKLAFFKWCDVYYIVFEK
jgi:hypothetical protein